MHHRTDEFRIPCASIQSVRRKNPGMASPGDTAQVRLEPGIIPFLETMIFGTEIKLGCGYHAPFTVPFGIAASAAYAILAPLQSGGVSWKGYDVEIHWTAAAQPYDVLLAEATVTAIDDGLACFSFLCRALNGADLLRGHLRLRAVQDGKTRVTSLLQSIARPVQAKPRLNGYSFLNSVDAPAEMNPGSRRTVSVEIGNQESPQQTLRASITLPPAAGLSLEGSSDPLVIELPPYSSTTVRWTIRADRSDELNHGQPWPISIAVRSQEAEERYTFHVAVPDAEPRRVFYILTEDCETFDGGPLTGNYGAAACLGNANNFMDPEDYRVQMILKPDRMNEIAERHGAVWTHFWCVPQRFAVDWASAQSATGEWPKLATQLDDSVQRGSVVHEYAPHIHFDYEPDSRHPPDPRLTYDPVTDGILPGDYYHPVTNPRHHYHDWDGSSRGIEYVKRLGDLTDIDSKAGSLRKSYAYLARMQSNRQCPIVARTGGFDFGVTPWDQATSTAAYAMNGLRANSDARFYDGSTAPDRLAYWCDPQDRSREMNHPDGTHLDDVQLAQLAVTHDTDFSNPAVDNEWFATAFQRLPETGVHLITAMTHAMFMRGAPDPFRSLEGGSFAGLDEHLRWIRAQYPEVKFATASGAVIEFIDYYAPRIEASVEAKLCGGQPEDGVYEYGVRLLGSGIRLDDRHPAEVQIFAPPLFDTCDVGALRVLANGQILIEQTGFLEASRPFATVTLSSRAADLRLQVLIKSASIARVAALFQGVCYQDPVERSRSPLLRLRVPMRGDMPTDVLRLLANSLAGETEPLGRRIHPWGVFLIGAAITGALQLQAEEQPGSAGCSEPSRIRLRWRKEVAADADVYSASEYLTPERLGVRISDHSGDVLAEGEVEFRSSTPLM